MREKAFIFDIDGTIADCSHRLHFLKPPAGLIHFKKDETDWKPDWDAFYDACGEDNLIMSVVRLCRALRHSGAGIIYVTGRPERIRDKTAKWIIHNGLPEFSLATRLFMRKDGDHRPDYEVKREIYETQIRNEYDVIGVFEDRKQCVDMWRALGLQCYQVNNGDY